MFGILLVGYGLRVSVWLGCLCGLLIEVILYCFDFVIMIDWWFSWGLILVCWVLLCCLLLASGLVVCRLVYLFVCVFFDSVVRVGIDI